MAKKRQEETQTEREETQTEKEPQIEKETRKKHKNSSFKRKVIMIVLMVLIPMIIIITVLFVQTNQIMQEKAFASLKYNIVDIQNRIDEMIHNIYNVSEIFGNESNIIKELDKSYNEKQLIEKRAAILRIQNRIMDRYSLLRKSGQITAIYTIKSGKTELFNLLDPNSNEKEQIKKLDELDITAKDKLSKFYWYPVQKNFLTDTIYNEIRKDYVIIGSRKIFSDLKAGYPYIHIFAVREEEIYKKYEVIEQQMDGDVYIINQQGTLFSSSNEEAVQKGSMEEFLVKQILNRSKDSFTLKMNHISYSINIAASQINDWMTVFVVPIQNVVRDINILYQRILWLIAGGFFVCGVMLLYLYRKFMAPISLLNESMKLAYHGNLDAYVPVKSNNEIGRMIEYYNAMLESINRNIKEHLEMEKRKKELEMEVLMNQVNPHFLYNTLETIVWKSGEAKRPDIGRIAASLGRMYRLSISNGDLMIKITREIEHVMTYVKIQKSRYEDQFEFDLRMDYETVQNYYTLKLILQPLVENSLHYGMQDLERTLKIRLSLVIRNNTVKITVADNGAGMSKEHLEQVRKQIVYGRKKEDINLQKRKSTGIGLHSIYARLHLYFGILDGIKLYSKEGFGTICTVKLPLIDGNLAKQYEKTNIADKDKN